MRSKMTRQEKEEHSKRMKHMWAAKRRRANATAAAIATITSVSPQAKALVIMNGKGVKSVRLIEGAGLTIREVEFEEVKL